MVVARLRTHLAPMEERYLLENACAIDVHKVLHVERRRCRNGCLVVRRLMVSTKFFGCGRSDALLYLNRASLMVTSESLVQTY